MPNYVQHALHRLQNSLPTRLQHAPHLHNKPVYVQMIQFYDSQDDTKEVFLSASSKTLIQQIIGIFLSYGIALDLTMLVALGTLEPQQSKPTESLWNDITWFLNYAASHPDAIFFFQPAT